VKTTIEIDGQLMAQAQRLSNTKDKSVVVDKALRLYVTVESQNRLLELWGKIGFDDTSSPPNHL
jgi:Arc/MetJ family transcription regulator